MKKISIISFVLFFVVGLGMASAQMWTHNAPANFRIDLRKGEWSPATQASVQTAWLFNGNQVRAGEVYELEITFRANRAIPAGTQGVANSLEITLVDEAEKAPNPWWTPLAEPWGTTDAIPADTDITYKITFTTTAGALSNGRMSNSINVASNSTQSTIRLTFSKFELRRVK